mmetsp:Transcript_23149/g.53218  ORF Transcript_23149/g.53218 Transcript_23149/m.53218 type:complete len:721 (-) Transcript_23149:44-2206(-)
MAAVGTVVGAVVLPNALVDSADDDDQFLDAEESKKLYEEAFGQKPGLRKGNAARFDAEHISRRQRVLEGMGLDPCGRYKDPPKGCAWLCSGYQEVRIRIGMKKLQVREERPYFESLYHLASHREFELFIASLIVLNCVCIAWDSYYRQGEDRPALLVASDHIFTAIFLIEFFIRVMAYSWVWMFTNNMNAFDTFLIWGPGVIIVWICPILGIGGATMVQSVGALRILRLARLCKAIRMIPTFRVLWILVQGVMECSSLLFWTWVIVGMLHFIFGVAVVELIAKTETFEDDEEVQYYFGSLVPAMCTLFQLMTFDAWGSIVRPLIKKSPASFLLFGLWMGIAGIVFFNLMTAIVVQNAFEQVKSDVEALEHWSNEKEKSIVAGLRRIFDDMDEDHSGTLTREEFSDVLVDIDFIRKMRSLDIELEELPDVFDILDDGDGAIDAKEFISGLMWMQGNAMNRDNMRATNLLRSTTKHLEDTMDELEHCVTVDLDFQEACWTNVSQDAGACIRATGDIITLLNQMGIRQLWLASFSVMPSVPDMEQTKYSTCSTSWRRIEKSKFPAPADSLVPLPPPEFIAERMPSTAHRVDRSDGLMHTMSKHQSIKEADHVIVEVLEDYEDQWSKLDLHLKSASALREATHQFDNHQLREVPALPGGLAALPPHKKRHKSKFARARSTRMSKGGASLMSGQPSGATSSMSPMSSLPSDVRGMPSHPHRVPGT